MIQKRSILNETTEIRKVIREASDLRSRVTFGRRSSVLEFRRRTLKARWRKTGSLKRERTGFLASMAKLDPLSRGWFLVLDAGDYERSPHLCFISLASADLMRSVALMAVYRDVRSSPF